MERTKDYLSKENTDCVKGIFAVSILLHHIAQFNPVELPYYVHILVQSMGYLSVSVFFFFSGYGLSLQYRKNKDYLKHFLRHRVLSLYGEYLFIMLLYLLFFLCIGRRFTAAEIFRSAVLYPTFVTNGWFFFSILLLYLIFYIVYRLVKTPRMQIAGILAGTALYCAAGIFLKWGYWLYISVWAFPAGIFWQMRKEKIDTYAKNAGHWWTGLTVSGILFAVTYVLAHTFRLPEACYMTVRAVSAVCFVIFLMWLCMKIPVRCRVTAFLGKYSLYIYTMQGMILYGLTNCTDIRKPWMYCLIAVPGTLILAVIVQNLQNKAKTLRISGRNMYKKR